MEATVLSKKDIPAHTCQSVPFVDLKRQYLAHREEILTAIDRVLSSGSYILGETVNTFETHMAQYLNCKYVLGVANATDALILALKSLSIGLNDEVIMPVNSFIATAGAAIAVGAKPVFCDVTRDLNIDVKKIESCITPKTKAIIPVHLTGRPANMDAIMHLAKQQGLSVIEDAAQSIGAQYRGKQTGTLGDIACFSLHPLKNLHVYGDGGFISTNDERLYQSIQLLRNHGLQNRDVCTQFGLNSRLDAMQACTATIGLKYLDVWNDRRRATATRYRHALAHHLTFPIDHAHEHAVYHNCVVLTERRDELMAFLLEKGIETKIHYPIPLHLQPAALQLGYRVGDFPVAEQLAKDMMSLPIYAELTDTEIDTVIEASLRFYD